MVDAGVKLGMLSKIISRLDRNAPEYGESCSDFKRNYVQAVAAASGLRNSNDESLETVEQLAIAWFF